MYYNKYKNSMVIITKNQIKFGLVMILNSHWSMGKSKSDGKYVCQK